MKIPFKKIDMGSLPLPRKYNMKALLFSEHTILINVAALAALPSIIEITGTGHAIIVSIIDNPAKTLPPKLFI